MNDEGQRRSCIMKETSTSGEVVETELWFVYPTGLQMLEDDNCDSYLIAALLPAMELKADIKVHGSVSKELLANLTELQYVWSKWLPDIYSLIDIKVDRIRENDVRIDGAVFAFSGGVDAQFTAYSHATGKAGYSTQVLRAGILVHGFDIPLSDKEGFSGAAQMASEVLSSLDIKLLTARTNIREVWNINWEHYFVAAVASVLCGLSKYAGAGLIGSSEPYEALIAPWGSHPMTDPMFSSGNFKIIHDGAGFSRSEKVEVISEWAVGMQNLRVCWAGGKHDSNCGICEKCVRTQLNLLLAGISKPVCFDNTLKESSFKPIVLSNEGTRAEWGQIRSDIKRTGNGIKWLPAIEKVLKRKPKLKPKIVLLLLPLGTQRRTLIKNLLKRVS